MYDRLLVPIDEGKLSIEAVKEAIGLAEDAETEIHGLYVSRDHQKQEEEAEKRSRLDELEERAKDNSLEFETAIRSGSPREEICNYADEKDVDAIVMATHARTGLQALVYGSVTQDTIKNAPCPVLVLPDPDWDDN